jgi:ATP-binding cassette subfamily B (MDR/TAP) protein 1
VSFFDRPENAAAALASRLSTVPTNLQDLIGMNIALILIVAVNIVSNVILAIVVGWKLGLVITFGALPFIFGSGYLRVRMEMKLNENTSLLFADSARYASEAVGAIRTVVSLTMEDTITSNYRERLSSLTQTTLQSTLWTMLWFSLAQSIDLLAMGLAFWYGGKLMSTGEYNTNQFFIVFIGIIFGGQAAGQLFSYTTSMSRVFYFYFTKPTNGN